MVCVRCSDIWSPAIDAFLHQPQIKPFNIQTWCLVNTAWYLLLGLEFQWFDLISSRTEQNELKMHTDAHTRWKASFAFMFPGQFLTLANSRILWSGWAYRESRKKWTSLSAQAEDSELKGKKMPNSVPKGKWSYLQFRHLSSRAFTDGKSQYK